MLNKSEFMRKTMNSTDENSLINEFDTKIVINDFDTKVVIDARGEKIKIFKYHLMRSVYFRMLLMENSKALQEDGSYYLDCDLAVFRDLLAYMETGIFRTMGISQKYLIAMCNKFGIEYDQELEKSGLPERLELRDNILKKKKLEKKLQEKKEFFEFVAKHISQGNLSFTIEFYPGDHEFNVISNEKIIYLFSSRLNKLISNMLSSHDILESFFENAIPKDHEVVYMSTNRMRSKILHFKITKNVEIV